MSDPGNKKIRREIRFLLNGEPVSLEKVRPDDTLLDFLRLDRRLTGTKEGCAEGDCGACTVLVSRLHEGGIRTEAVNACIRLMPSLDSQAVQTVEAVAGRDGTLNPVQAAMVEHHGSQCGFCTPGFVMALQGLCGTNSEPTDAAIEKAIQGNLCRCTGYEAILRAARAAAAAPKEDAPEQASVLAQLQAWNEGARVEAAGADGTRSLIPADADDLAAILLAEPDTRVVAGATDVGLWVTKGMAPISPAVFIAGLSDLKTVTETDGMLSIGAGVTYTEAFEILTRKVPALGRLIDRIGGDQIRNCGTIGGNIANGSPIGDMPPPLIALGATLVLRLGGERRRLPLENFFLAYGTQDRQPGEFVEAVEVPLPAPGALFDIHKVTKRRDEDITAVLSAFHLTLEEGAVTTARLAYGGMAGTPKRAFGVENALIGKAWTHQTVEAALPAFEADFIPLTDMRATSAYRMTVAKNLLRRFFLETTDAVPLTQVRRHEAA